jgi:branched-chain amino acid transport system substrate-binding protein
MYLFQVKMPEESRQPCDYYTLPSTVPGDKAFRPLSASECPLVRAAKKSVARSGV